VAVEQRSGTSVAGPFGAAAGMSRSGSIVTASGATVEYTQQRAAVAGPLGGVRSGSASYVHAESADHSIGYMSLSTRDTPLGPAGAILARTAAVGPFGAADFPPAGAALAPQASSYRYERTAVGPGGGVAVEQGSGSTVAGPFGAAVGASRSGSVVTASGATLEYAQRSAAVAGPLGGVRSGGVSYVQAASADRSLGYMSLSRSVSRSPGPLAWP
jgi:hypothetical protein